MALGIAFAACLCACSTQQMQTTTQVRSNSLAPGLLKDSGIAFIIPSSVTGQEEDRQALALGFVEAMRQARPDLRVASLDTVLSAINKAGFASDYRRMLEDYRLTGIFDREVLQRIAAASSSRYVAQLKLAGFRQNSSGRWGFLGVRLVDTRSASLRLFLQIWDSVDGSIVWEGAEELTLAHESAEEANVTFTSAVEQSARHLVARLP
jgi:hypothetical protein